MAVEACRRLRREARVEDSRLPQSRGWSFGAIRQRGSVAGLAVLEGQLARRVLHRVIDAARDVRPGGIRHQGIVAGRAVLGDRAADVGVERAIAPIRARLVADGAFDLPHASHPNAPDGHRRSERRVVIHRLQVRRGLLDDAGGALGMAIEALRQEPITREPGMELAIRVRAPVDGV